MNVSPNKLKKITHKLNSKFLLRKFMKYVPRNCVVNCIEIWNSCRLSSTNPFMFSNFFRLIFLAWIYLMISSGITPKFVQIDKKVDNKFSLYSIINTAKYFAIRKIIKQFQSIPPASDVSQETALVNPHGFSPQFPTRLSKETK